MDLCSLNYTEERAEDIKKSIGNAMPQEGTKRRNAGDGIDYTEVNNYVHARADEIVANIMAQPEYAGMRDTDLPGGIVIVGGGFTSARVQRAAVAANQHEGSSGGAHSLCTYH